MANSRPRPLANGGTERERALQALPASRLRRTETHRGLRAGEVAPEHVVDHPADGVGAVDRGGAVAEDLDALHAARWQLVDVHGLGKPRRHRVDRHAPAVDEDEGGGGAEVAEVDVRVVTPRTRRAEPGLVLGQIHDGGKRREQVDRQQAAAHVDRGLVQDRHRRDLLHLGPLNVGAGDDETLELGWGGRGGSRRHGRCSLGRKRRGAQQADEDQERRQAAGGNDQGTVTHGKLGAGLPSGPRRSGNGNVAPSPDVFLRHAAVTGETGP